MDQEMFDPFDIPDDDTYVVPNAPDPLCKCKHRKSLHTYAQDSMFEPTSYLCTSCSCGNFQPTDPFEDE